MIYPLSGIRKEAGIAGMTKSSLRARDAVARLSKRIWGPKLEHLGRAGSTGPAEFIEALDNRLLTRSAAKNYPLPGSHIGLDGRIRVSPSTLINRRSASELGLSDRARKRLMSGYYETANHSSMQNSLGLTPPDAKRALNATYEGILRKPIRPGIWGTGDKLKRFSELSKVE